WEAEEFGVARCRGTAIAPRAAELRPVRPGPWPAAGQRDEHQQGKETAPAATEQGFDGDGERALVTIHSQRVIRQTTQVNDAKHRQGAPNRFPALPRPLARVQRPVDWSDARNLLAGNVAPGQRV